MIDRFENDARSKFSMVLNARTLPFNDENAGRLVEVAQRLVAGGRDASSLDLLGGTLYRAGRYEEAIRTLQESIVLHGKGGYSDTWLFLALAQQRLGKEDEARRNLTRLETWLAGTTFASWGERMRWKLLHEEARALILKMPRAGE
jgi:Flp pilus assembly protein TadD